MKYKRSEVHGGVLQPRKSCTGSGDGGRPTTVEGQSLFETGCAGAVESSELVCFTILHSDECGVTAGSRKKFFSNEQATRHSKLHDTSFE